MSIHAIAPMSARDRAEQALTHSSAAAAVDQLEASRAANVGIGWALLAVADAIAAAGIDLQMPPPPPPV